MATAIAASTKPAYQTNSYLWGLRFIQFLFAIIIVALTGANISDWHGLGCTNPPHLSFNFAIGLISLFLLIYYILSTGPYIKLRYWSFPIAVALDIISVIFWIVAASLAGYDCDSICAACSTPGQVADQGYGYLVQVNDVFCTCVFDTDQDYYSKRRDIPANIFRRGFKSTSGSSNTANLGKTLEKGASTAAKRGLDAAMILLFIISLVTLLALRYSSGRTASTQAAVAHNAEPVDNVYQMNQTDPGVTNQADV